MNKLTSREKRLVDHLTKVIAQTKRNPRDLLRMKQPTNRNLLMQNISAAYGWAGRLTAILDDLDKSVVTEEAELMENNQIEQELLLALDRLNNTEEAINHALNYVKKV